MRKSLRQTTWHGSFNLSSGTISVNFKAILARFETSSAAPVVEISRMVQGILSPLLAMNGWKWTGGP